MHMVLPERTAPSQIIASYFLVSGIFHHSIDFICFGENFENIIFIFLHLSFLRLFSAD